MSHDALMARRCATFYPNLAGKEKDEVEPLSAFVAQFKMREMAERLSNPIPWLLSGVALAVIVGFLSLAGSAVVVDESGGVTSAVITDGNGGEQRLHRVWSGYFYAIPNMGGAIEVRCRNGVRKQWGYVSGYMHTKIRVVGQTPCARVMDSD